MNKLILILAVAFSLSVFLPSDSLARCGMDHGNKGGIINNRCPVMGDRVDENTPHKVVHRGKRIGLCCSGCVPEFKKNPDRYMRKLEKMEKKEKIECPKCGSEIKL
jgi:YHS domain-containing protein